MCDSYKIIENYSSEMVTYWLSFMNTVEVLMMNIHSLKLQDCEMFKASLQMMILWMQIYGNNNYAKWRDEFWLEISTLLGEINANMKHDLFAQSITGKPYTCLPLDLWIEMTMNKGSKMKTGLNTINANLVNRIKVSLREVANLKPSTSEQHRENTRMHLKYDELAVQDLEICIAAIHLIP